MKNRTDQIQRPIQGDLFEGTKAAATAAEIRLRSKRGVALPTKVAPDDFDRFREDFRTLAVNHNMPLDVQNNGGRLRIVATDTVPAKRPQPQAPAPLSDNEIDAIYRAFATDQR